MDFFGVEKFNNIQNYNSRCLDLVFFNFNLRIVKCSNSILSEYNYHPSLENYYELSKLRNLDWNSIMNSNLRNCSFRKSNFFPYMYHFWTMITPCCQSVTHLNMLVTYFMISCRNYSESISRCIDPQKWRNIPAALHLI